MSYPMSSENTPLEDIYNCFFGKITDDQYMEWTKEDTEADLVNIFTDSVSSFEFPRFPLYDYDLSVGEYHCHLTLEEINILAICMVETWLQRQITSIENTRQKYSGSNLAPLSRKRQMTILGESGRLKLLTRVEGQI